MLNVGSVPSDLAIMIAVAAGKTSLDVTCYRILGPGQQGGKEAKRAGRVC